MAFRFSLSALLRLRSTLERIEESKLLFLRQEAQLLAASGERIATARRNLRIEPAPNLVGPSPLSAFFTGADFQFLNLQQTRMAWQEQQIRRQLVEKQYEVQTQMAAFTEARRKRQVLESLRERELAMYALEERRRDQRRLDDAFLLLLIRQRAASRG